MTNVLDLVAYKNGEYKPLGEIGPSILDFGFIHCDATYDVMPVYNGKAFCYERHLQRFKNSAERYGLTIPDVDPLEIIKELAKRNPIDNAFVWFIIWRGFPPSGNPRDLENCPVNFAMYIKPSYPIASTPLVRLYLDKQTNRVNDDYYGQEYKNMAWIDLTMSQRNTPPGFDTTVLVDVDGFVTEGPGFNVGIVKDGIIKTADKNVLKGITMSVVEDIAKENSITFKRMPITQTMFNSADEIFITSSSGGVTPTTITGEVTKTLVSKYKDKKEQYGTLL
jgi:branched-chain amino acid aminotransferase